MGLEARDRGHSLVPDPPHRMIVVMDALDASIYSLFSCFSKPLSPNFSYQTPARTRARLSSGKPDEAPEATVSCADSSGLMIIVP